MINVFTVTSEKNALLHLFLNKIILLTPALNVNILDKGDLQSQYHTI